MSSSLLCGASRRTVSNVDDDAFRVVLLVGLLILLPIAAYQRARSATGERLDRRQEGRFILFTLRPVGAACMAGLMAYIMNPHWMTWSSVPLPVWLRWTGVGLGVAAGGLLTWTLRSLGKNLTDTVVTRRDHVLVTSGPYQWVRHPFYSSVALAVLANSLVAANWFLFVTGVSSVALAGCCPASKACGALGSTRSSQLLPDLADGSRPTTHPPPLGVRHHRSVEDGPYRSTA